MASCGGGNRVLTMNWLPNLISWRARAQRRGAVAMVIEVLQIAARLSNTAKARSERLLQAAEIATDLGRPGLLEHLLREADGGSIGRAGHRAGRMVSRNEPTFDGQ